MTGATQVQSKRHQVAIAGNVSNAETGAAIGKATVKMTAMPIALTRWLDLKALQFTDQWQSVPDQPESQRVWLDRQMAVVKVKEQLNLVTYTSLDGQFYFVDLLAGSYKLEVSVDATGTIARLVVDIKLPPTGIQGRVIDQNASDDPQKTGIIMAKIQPANDEAVTLSDRKGQYRLTGLSAGKSSPEAIATPHLSIVKVSARGYEPQTIEVLLNQGQMTLLDVSLARRPPP
jgi:hypothetical protein